MKQRPQAFYQVKFPSSVELFDFHLMKRNKPYRKNLFLTLVDYRFFCIANLYKKVEFDALMLELLALGWTCDGIILERPFKQPERRLARRLKTELELLA